LGEVRRLGVDETTWLTATREHSTKYATSLVDLERRIVIDVVEGNSAADLGAWLDGQPEAFTDGIRVVATDLAESYRRGLEGRIDQATRVADPFHVVRVANRALDTVRRLSAEPHARPPGQEARSPVPDPQAHAHRHRAPGRDGRRPDAPRPSNRRPRRRGARRLARQGIGARHLLAESISDAELLIDRAIEGCRLDAVGEVRSLGLTLARWRDAILARHRTGASNGPTEGLNLLVKKVKRAGHGFRSFDNYRLRILLHAGGVSWDSIYPSTPRIRGRAPHSNA
jgi:transposase